MNYETMIDMAQTLDELDSIIEFIADDDVLTNDEFCDLYKMALHKAIKWKYQEDKNHGNNIS